MKSIFHIGIDLPSHSKEGLKKGFLQAGFTEYTFFDWQAVRLDVGILGCQARLLKAAQSLRPDLVFCQLQNSEIFDEETAMELSKCGFTVNYSFDVRDAERTEWMFELAHYFNLTLFACKEDADESRRRGILNVGHMHSSCDTAQYRPMVLCDEEKSKYPEIVFIGNNYERTNLNFEQSKQREEMVNFMKAEFGNQFGVFGMNWGSQSKIINPIEEVLIYNSAKIVICHNNFIREQYCSDRQWRAIACGVLTIPQYYEGFMNEMFGPMWMTFEHIKNNCIKFLRDPYHAKQVADGQRNNFLVQHTWKHRIENIKSMIYELNPTN